MVFVLSMSLNDNCFRAESSPQRPKEMIIADQSYEPYTHIGSILKQHFDVVPDPNQELFYGDSTRYESLYDVMNLCTDRERFLQALPADFVTTFKSENAMIKFLADEKNSDLFKTLDVHGLYDHSPNSPQANEVESMTEETEQTSP